jgi:hypothetical protein
MVIEEELIIALRNFDSKVEDGSFVNLFLLARQRAKADGVDITDAIMAELLLRKTL